MEALLDSGFHHVVVLDGAECGLDAEQSLILALWCYEAEKQPASNGAWIHPYYFASQKAYTAASSLVKSGAFPGLALRDEIRVKPIFARLPDFSQGTNTISYIRGIGSRFGFLRNIDFTVKRRFLQRQRADSAAACTMYINQIFKIVG